MATPVDQGCGFEMPSRLPKFVPGNISVRDPMVYIPLQYPPLWDMYAAAALTGLLGHCSRTEKGFWTVGPSRVPLAQAAFEIADAMMAKRGAKDADTGI